MRLLTHNSYLLITSTVGVFLSCQKWPFGLSESHLLLVLYLVCDGSTLEDAVLCKEISLSTESHGRGIRSEGNPREIRVSIAGRGRGIGLM